MTIKKNPELGVNHINAKSVCIGDIISWNLHNIYLKVVKVRESSVIAKFLDFPVKGHEAYFEHDMTVINHTNYTIKEKRKRA
ncbi:DUF2187 family protein [Metabacillus niabensis]|uniref:DUF2187 family protein n=1 Tax=Metabacillus niabensis TaxID=324854 RepID=UPI0011A5D001